MWGLQESFLIAIIYNPYESMQSNLSAAQEKKSTVEGYWWIEYTAEEESLAEETSYGAKI